ncbi:putative nuclear migration protein [Aspergillus melleus]|uniref:putative nuclear migration protein n=1 Tax=Aspergillus melleus TaxID=138277 RepID=UPI001E8DF9BE|nr:uncharacterized protein LDX57_003380 [Aspergillus melleus]KAH8425631.1 hypothetical protein LDX57_003380 [Aspergillus melleus]
MMATDTMPRSSPAQAFPMPSATPQRIPSIHVRRDSSPGPLTSPPSLPTQNFSPDGRSDYDDGADEDALSPFDPRRFTPTLHASLVSEILSLRRDVESKTKAIDVLERSLDDSRNENEDLAARLSQSTKETRSLRHQLQLLEGGSSSALTELARERDEAQENIADVRKKLEQTQKRARSREEDMERTLNLWERDKQSWENERRNMERKVHVVEGRLKVVLNEVAAAQTAGSSHSGPDTDETATTKEGMTGKDSDSASIRSGSSQGRRRTSVTSVSSDEGDYHNIRYSVASIANVPGINKPDGLSLAQELAFDEDEEFGLPDEDLVPASPEALPEERPVSVQSHISHTIGMGAKARKILGLSLHGSNDGHPTRGDGTSELSSPWKAPVSYVYRDSGIQYSPPPSPKLPTESENLPSSRYSEESHGDSQAPAGHYSSKDTSTSTVSADMVSTSCQTVADLPTPPWTPLISEMPPSPSLPEPAVMVSTSVQTEELAPAKIESKRVSLQQTDSASPELAVPMIAIHPPCSDPPSPRGSVVLPPQTKSASCQADLRPAVETQTVGIQTEEIRIDQRSVKLPASLLPSAIPDLPLNMNAQDVPVQPYRAPPPRPIKGERKPKSSVDEKPAKPVSETQFSGHTQAYPGNNDNGPLSEESKTDIRRPFRSSSLFAGFEPQSDEEEPSEESKDIFTDDALLNRPFAAYKLKRGKLVSTQDRPSVDESVREVDEHLIDLDARRDTAKDADFMGSSQGPRSGMATPTARQQDIRRAAMISSGAAAHQKIRPRSPSEPSIDSGSASGASSVAPPFPVPIRLSSRKFPVNGSEGRQSPTPSNHPRNFSDRTRPPIVRRPTLRRVRSAAAMSHTEHDRPGSLSSPMSGSSFGQESPHQPYPPLPFDELTMPRDRRSSQRQSNHHRATPPRGLLHERQDSTATSVQPTSVVDAIAQTMVGEWMFKYIRRRRSFGGVGESKDNWEGRNAEEVSANITNSGVRHKRWVWLAPYERAVMWSSKQPTSGPALLGKSGRKLLIQSVLDVKDDNPLPKGANPHNQFNRSILILTPQRALKFTASSIERHYVWLSALSFLSHSAMGLHDLSSLPPAPQEEFTPPAQPASLRRNPIRDSIRIAKGRPRPGPKGKRSLNQPEPVPEIPAGRESTNSMDAADPPTVPRFSNHARKRSNTTPRMPAIPTIRSFSSQGTMPSNPSTRGSSDTHGPQSHGAATTINSGRSSYSRRTSETSVRTGTSNFFDAIGTVRMEAFIDQADASRIRPTRARHGRKVSSPWGAPQNPRFREPDYSPYDDFEHFHHDDPFRGF